MEDNRERDIETSNGIIKHVITKPCPVCAKGLVMPNEYLKAMSRLREELDKYREVILAENTRILDAILEKSISRVLNEKVIVSLGSEGKIFINNKKFTHEQDIKKELAKAIMEELNK